MQTKKEKLPIYHKDIRTAFFNIIYLIDHLRIHSFHPDLRTIWINYKDLREKYY